MVFLVVEARTPGRMDLADAKSTKRGSQSASNKILEGRSYRCIKLCAWRCMRAHAIPHTTFNHRRGVHSGGLRPVRTSVNSLRRERFGEIFCEDGTGNKREPIEFGYDRVPAGKGKCTNVGNEILSYMGGISGLTASVPAGAFLCSTWMARPLGPIPRTVSTPSVGNGSASTRNSAESSLMNGSEGVEPLQ
jgi:hypothetical protein